MLRRTVEGISAKALWHQRFIESTSYVRYVDDGELGNWSKVMPMASMWQCFDQGNYVQSMHAYNDWTCKACLHVHELVHAYQMHNYIYIYSAHTIGEMLMIACMQ